MKILIINGPNINMLGIREKDIYGSRTYEDLLNIVKDFCVRENIETEFFQSNHEGAIVDKIQTAYGNFAGIVINPAAYTHTSIAILDALKSVAIPTVEVHISDVENREDFRKISYISPACIETIKGHGFDGYIMAIESLRKRSEHR
ncbi:MAG: type II 3-dehydroquinate dehydratase [Oscillospiraceae bacterium]|nr:type II 3-dehydroquinate dehydratase [Oscillospiraceae bacterium]